MLRDAVLRLLAVVLAGGATAGAAAHHSVDLTDEQYSRFPRLFHLDDHDGCLLREGGVYCMGVFQLAAKGHNPTFDLMQEYSKDIHNFNRTFVHRGYCVSARCPASALEPAARCPASALEPAARCPASALEPAARFARCFDRWGQQHGFHTQLHKLEYCSTHQTHVLEKWHVETPHRAFLWVLAVMLLLNVVGTVYDATTLEKKSQVLVAWSVRANWQHLKGPFPAGDPRLAALLPVEATRVIIMLLAIFAHSGCIHDMLYLHNPRHIEQMSHHPILMILQNGTSAIQLFIFLSSFFLAQNLLREKEIGTRAVVKVLLKRIVRIAPVYLLAVGFAATWWPLIRASSGGGPQWAPLVEAESQACRNKFWSFAFFVGNFVRDDENCLLQSWFIGVDMQLYVVGAVLTAVLARRRCALAVLSALFVACVAACATLAYLLDWAPMMTISGPENVRTLFKGEPSFRQFYTKPWGSLPAALTGLFMAHLLDRLRESSFDARDHQMLIMSCQLLAPLVPLWTSAGNLFRGVVGWRAAVYLALERPIMCLISAPLLFGALNGNGNKIDTTSSQSPGTEQSGKGKAAAPRGYLHRVFCWRAWFPLGRLSLAALMLHWCVNLTLAASRPTLYHSTALHMLVDFLATSVLTYLAAVPVTVLLDIPMQQLFKALSS